MSDALVLDLTRISPSDFAAVGGKGANLGALTAMGLSVPSGFCVTTHGFRAFVAEDVVFDEQIAGLEKLQAEDIEGARTAGEALRAHLTSRPLPHPVADAVREALAGSDPTQAWAVRSSATAEDLPGASFAGQQDTYLNIIGADSVLEHVRRCFASLYTDRAILYRMQQGIPHRGVALSAVVQRMVQPRSSGILFTADPVSGHRGVMAIDAGFGLGEAFVSGTVSADLFRIDRRSGRVIEEVLATKTHAIRSLPAGGTENVALSAAESTKASLTPPEIAALVAAGEAIEVAQGCPQDIEWCFDEQGLHIVQARPITSLFPLPTEGLEPERLWFCFNHFQVMTDAMPPLVCDIWRLLMPFGRELIGDPRPAPWVLAAGGRLWVDMGPAARFGPTRKMMLFAFGKVEALAQGALAMVTQRPEFGTGPSVSGLGVARFFGPKLATLQKHLWLVNLDTVQNQKNAWLDGLVHRVRGTVQAGDLKRRVLGTHIELSNLFGELLNIIPAVLPGFLASGLLRKLMPEHGQHIDALGRGLHGNVTVEMDLDVGDLADTAHGLPEVKSALLDGRPWQDQEGATAFRAALDTFLDTWGSRATSEIDFSRPRWSEDPTAILSAVAGNLATGKPGGARAHHAELARRGEAAQRTLIDAGSKGIFGWLRGRVVRRLTRAVRALAPMREHPKFAIIRIGAAVRELVEEVGVTLAADDRLLAAEDVWFLQWDELEEAVHGFDDYRVVVGQRKAEHARDQALYPPRVMTGEGEVPQVSHDADVPDGALAGTAASAGVVEGIARVVRDPRTEVLHKGEILIAPFTDPGWTPLFINAAGLVMEVGGLMTHGSVVAREYGIPAVVCVPDATAAIKTGQRVRLNGTEGWVQVLEDPAEAPASE
ncbi:MAG: phosphoenolpyruvate synthase [Deltaproteobacteria bacterium]|nr:phosphoenolpyruvate synthase [Deltaproteobacteria bacterium]